MLRLTSRTQEDRDRELCKILNIRDISEIKEQKDIPLSELEGILKGLKEGKGDYDLIHINRSGEINYSTGLIFGRHYQNQAFDSLNLGYFKSPKGRKFLDVMIIGEKQEYTGVIRIPKPSIAIKKELHFSEKTECEEELSMEREQNQVSIQCFGWMYSLDIKIPARFDLESGFYFQGYKLERKE